MNIRNFFKNGRKTDTLKETLNICTFEDADEELQYWLKNNVKWISCHNFQKIFQILKIQTPISLKELTIIGKSVRFLTVDNRKIEMFLNKSNTISIVEGQETRLYTIYNNYEYTPSPLEIYLKETTTTKHGLELKSDYNYNLDYINHYYCGYYDSSCYRDLKFSDIDNLEIRVRRKLPEINESICRILLENDQTVDNFLLDFANPMDLFKVENIKKILELSNKDLNIDSFNNTISIFHFSQSKKTEEIILTFMNDSITQIEENNIAVEKNTGDYSISTENFNISRTQLKDGKNKYEFYCIVPENLTNSNFTKFIDFDSINRKISEKMEKMK